MRRTLELYELHDDHGPGTGYQRIAIDEDSITPADHGSVTQATNRLKMWCETPNPTAEQVFDMILGTCNGYEAARELPNDEGQRHAGPDHLPVPTGHIAGNPKRRRQAQKSRFLSAVSDIEDPMTSDLQDLFARQKKATVSRLMGKRGKAFRRALPAVPPQDGQVQPAQPPPPPGQGALTTAAVALAPALAAAGIARSAVEFPGKAAIDAALLQALFDVLFWRDQTVGVVAPHIKDAVNTAIGHVAADVDAPVNIEPPELPGEPRQVPFGLKTTELAPAIIRGRSELLGQRVTDTTLQQVKEAVASGVENGEGIEEIRGRIEKVFDNAGSQRARTIARTEAVGALNEGAWRYAGMLPAGVLASKTWLSHHDSRVRPEHLLADGQEVPVGSPFYIGGYPAEHPGDRALPPSLAVNCVVEGTRVEWAGGLQAVYRRWYSGKVFQVLQTNGAVFTVTPNHPILTPEGWVAVQALERGGKVAVSVIVGGGPQPEVKNIPLRVEEVYRAARQEWTTCRISGSSVDFHGDVPDGEVDVVRPDGELWPDNEAMPEEVLFHRHLLGAALGARPSPAAGQSLSVGRLSARGGRQDSSSTSRLSGTGELATFLLAEPNHSQAIGLAAGTDGQPDLSEAMNYDGTRTSELLSNAQHAHPVVVELAQVVQVKVIPWAGHVYNLQTEHGWYSANDAITHNCRCSVAYNPPHRARPGLAPLGGNQ